MKEDGYGAIRWLASNVLLVRGFIARTEKEGLDAVLKDCPYDDLREDQRATFEAAFGNEDLQECIYDFWDIYDELRESGEISAASPWEP